MNSKYPSFNAFLCLITFAFFICLSIKSYAATATKPVTDGWNLFSQNNLVEAKSAFESAIATNPRDVAAWHGLSAIDLMQDESISESELQTVVNLAPNDPRAWEDWHSLLNGTAYFGANAPLISSGRSLVKNPAAPRDAIFCPRSYRAC